MDKPQLTPIQLKNYLWTGLRIILWSVPKSYETELIPALLAVCDSDEHVPNIKPLCYQLSDLNKFIPELGFVPLKKIENMPYGHCDHISKERNIIIQLRGFDHWFNNIPIGIINQLIEWHFWVFDQEYFEQGLVIDKLQHGKEASNV